MHSWQNMGGWPAGLQTFFFPLFCAFAAALFSYNKEERKAIFAKVAAPDYYRLASAKGHPSLLALVFLHF